MFTKANHSRMTMAVAILVGSLLVAAPALAASQAVVVKGYSVSGAVVQVTVKNTSARSITGTVAVQAVVNDTPIWSLVPVVLLGGQSACVSAAFSAPVKSVTSVSMNDDTTPF